MSSIAKLHRWPAAVAADVRRRIFILARPFRLLTLATTDQRPELAIAPRFWVLDFGFWIF